MEEKIELRDFSVIDPAMISWIMALKKWNYGTGARPTCCLSWHDPAMVYWLKEGKLLEVWSFRKEAKLAFALSTDPGSSLVFKWGRTSRRGQRILQSAVSVS